MIPERTTWCVGKGCRRTAGMSFGGRPLCPKCGRKWTRKRVPELRGRMDIPKGKP